MDQVPQMSRLLDPTWAFDIGDELVRILVEDGGYTPEQAIPGLIRALVQFAESTNEFDQLMDESANMLADGGPARVDHWSV